MAKEQNPNPKPETLKSRPQAAAKEQELSASLGTAGGQSYPGYLVGLLLPFRVYGVGFTVNNFSKFLLALYVVPRQVS